MRKLLSAAIAVVLLAAIPAAASADTVTVPVAADASVEQGNPTTNYGSGLLRIDGDPQRWALVQYQVPTLEGTVSSATLRVYKEVGSPSQPWEVHSVPCTWDYNTVTWDTRPTLGATVGNAAGYPAPGAGWVDVTVDPAAVQSGSVCFALTKPVSSDVWITADDLDAANPSQLVLTTQPTSDTTPPETTITSGPADGGTTTDRTPTFEFSADEPATFQCTLDSRVLFDCSSPFTLNEQAQGGHSFTVQATDAAGNVDPTPAGRNFTVLLTPVSTCSDAPLVNATPSTMGSILANNNRVRINAAPDTYGNLSKTGNSTSCIVIKCTVTAKSGTFSSNSSGCILSSQSTFQNIKDLTVESFVVKSNGSGEYGLQHYDQANVGSNTRFANNVFDETNDHDISTKNRGSYFEVEGNWFLRCSRHCWEIGQNGNIRTRPSTTGTSVFRGNTAYSPTGNIITQRYNLNLLVENNTFKGAAGRAVMTWPYWTFYNFPDSGAEAACRTGSENGALYVPGSTPCEGGQIRPLRTTLRNNTFTGKSDLLFIGRGVIDDKVLLQGNTGITSCARVHMDYWTSGTAAAHINGQTTAGPQLDPASDRAC